MGLACFVYVRKFSCARIGETWTEGREETRNQFQTLLFVRTVSREYGGSRIVLFSPRDIVPLVLRNDFGNSLFV